MLIVLSTSVSLGSDETLKLAAKLTKKDKKNKQLHNYFRFFLSSWRFFAHKVVTLQPDKYICTYTMKAFQLLCSAWVAVFLLTMTGCTKRTFRVEGQIVQAHDSLLYLENMGLNGPVVVDSVRLDKEGNFSFSSDAPTAPEFYRLRIGQQIINIAIDSTETVKVKADYPAMSSAYTVEGSAECEKVRELALMQMELQNQVNTIVALPTMSANQVVDSVGRLLEQYKQTVKTRYIFREPMRAYAYYALFQTVALGNTVQLIFDPRANEDDVKVFAAVATSWDTYYPGSERGKNLHNIAIEGMKNVRILRAQRNQTIDASKVNTSGIIDIVLPDNKGAVRRLTQLKGKVVLLDFNVFKAEGSVKHNMWLRSVYNKYHDRGLEIYQVSLDDDEHFWKTSTEALPWICVRDAASLQSAFMAQYNVQQLPTFFLIDRNNVLQKRDVQISNLDSEINAML